MPRIGVNNHHLGKTLTEQSREVFNGPTLDTPSNQFSSTGFNKNLIPATEAALHATSRRYGKSTMQRTAANHQPIDYHTTTTRAGFMSPDTHVKPNWRNRNMSVQFDNSQAQQIKNMTSAKLASGYSSNRQHWDGTSWATEKNQHTDQTRTLYRLGFNQPKPFHKPVLRNNDGRMKARAQIYDVSDK